MAAGIDWTALLQSLGASLGSQGQTGATPAQTPTQPPMGNTNPMQSAGMSQYAPMIVPALNMAASMMGNGNQHYATPQAAHAAFMQQLASMPGMIGQLHNAMQGVQNTGFQRQNNAVGLAQGLPGMPSPLAGVMGAQPVAPQFQQPGGISPTGPSLVGNPFGPQQQAPYQPGMQGMLTPYL